MSLFKFFQLLQYSSLLSAMRSSPWVFPVIASIHLMGLALIGGAVLLVDLRLLGLGMRNQPLPQIARYAERWFVVSLAILLPTGILQFMCFAGTVGNCSHRGTRDRFTLGFTAGLVALFPSGSEISIRFIYPIRRKSGRS